MKTLTRLLILPTLVLSLMASQVAAADANPPPSQADPQLAPANHRAVALGEIVFSETEKDGYPNKLATEFPAGTRQLYAFFDYQGVHDEATLTGTWYRGGYPLMQQAHTLAGIFGPDAPEKGTLWFIARIQSGFTPGFYRLELSIDGRLSRIGTFAVEPSTSKPVFANVSFTGHVAAEGNGFQYPIASTVEFPLDTPHLYAAFDHFNMLPGARWGWRLSREGVLLVEDMDQRWNVESDGSYALPLTLPHRPGLYDFDLFIDGELADSQSLIVGDPGAPRDRLVQSDNFDTPATGWTKLKDDGGELGYKDGRYSITLHSLEPYWGTSDRTLDDFVVEVDAAPMSAFADRPDFDGPRGDVYGLVARAQDNRNFYAFVVGSDERYAVFHLRNGRLFWDTEWTAANSDILRPNSDENRLRLYADGPELRFYVNGHMLARVANAEWSSGTAGVLAANAYADYFAISFGFDNWRVWALPTGKESGFEALEQPSRPAVLPAPKQQPVRPKEPTEPPRRQAPVPDPLGAPPPPQNASMSRLVPFGAR